MTTPDNNHMNQRLRSKSGRPPPPPMPDSNSPMNQILRRSGPGEAQVSLRPIDPDDIDRWLEPADFTDEDGGIDEDAKAAAIAALLAEKPYLGVTETPPPRVPRVAGGPRSVTEPSEPSVNDLLRGTRAANRRILSEEVRESRADRLGHYPGNDAA